MLSALFMICALRTNIVFVIVLALLTCGLCCGAGAFWHFAEGELEKGANLVIVSSAMHPQPVTDLVFANTTKQASGALTFAFTMMVWYLLAVQLLEAVDFPITLPVGDLSKVIKGKSEKAAMNAARDARQTEH